MTNKRNPSPRDQPCKCTHRCNSAGTSSDVLLIRARAAREEFAGLANLAMPKRVVRFQVKIVGKAYPVVDLASSKTKAFRWTYKTALDIAIQFEEKFKEGAESLEK